MTTTAHHTHVHDQHIADTTRSPLPAGSQRRQDLGFQAFTLDGAAHARVRETLLAQRALLESLATLLIQHEVVDRHALDRLLATPVPEAAPSAPASG
jgi:hypothetical protein